MNASSLLMLFAFGGASFGAASTGAIFRPGAWYSRLDKPPWRPPDWLFAPVWTLLYAMIALSGWLVWREKGVADALVPLTAYSVQLVLNAAWTPISCMLRMYVRRRLIASPWRPARSSRAISARCAPSS